MLEYFVRYRDFMNLYQCPPSACREILSPIPAARATIGSLTSIVRRNGFNACTALPKGVSVVSSRRSASSGRRPGASPIVRLRENVIATGELHAAIFQRFVGTDFEALPGLGLAGFSMSPARRATM